MDEGASDAAEQDAGEDLDDQEAEGSPAHDAAAAGAPATAKVPWLSDRWCGRYRTAEAARVGYKVWGGRGRPRGGGGAKPVRVCVRCVRACSGVNIITSVARRRVRGLVVRRVGCGGVRAHRCGEGMVGVGVRGGSSVTTGLIGVWNRVTTTFAVVPQVLQRQCVGSGVWAKQRGRRGGVGVMCRRGAAVGVRSVVPVGSYAAGGTRIHRPEGTRPAPDVNRASQRQ